MKSTIKSLKSGAVRLLVLALGLGLARGAWAADAPTITVDGTTVTINNETSTAYDSSKTLTVNSTWQAKKFWLPTGTGLDSGAMVKVTSIAFAVPSTGNFVDKIGLAGSVSASAVRTTGGFTTANADKVLFSFEECYLRAGYGTTLWFLDSNGEKVAATTVINFMVGGNSYQHIDNLGWTISNVFYTPVIEVVGEIVDGSYLTGVQTAIGNSGTDPLYAAGVTGWLDTSNSKTGPVVLVGNNDGTASIGVNNANSVDANGQHSTWSKLSGSGTLTSLYTSDIGVKSSTSPVLEVYDSSEFTGSIITPVDNGPKLSVVFCNADESATLKTSYNGLFRHNSGSNPASIYVSAGRTTANNAVVTIPANKTWTANKLLNNGEVVVDGTFNGPVGNTGSLTVNGTVTGAIVNSGNGTVVVNEGATIASFGSQRDFTGITVDSSVPVKLAMTTEEYGKGSVSVTGANGISSITVLAPDGTTEVGTITPEEGAGTLETGVKTSGLSTWCDYEFNGDKSNTGVDKTGLESDVNTTTYPEIFNSSMLYTYTHPWRNISYPNSWTAVVRCTVPELENAVVVMFGTYSAGAIGLVAGSNPEEEMLLVSTPGSSATTSEAKHFTTLATMNVKDATTAQHVYVFTKDGTTVNVYCDGEKVLDNYELASATLGGGLQVGSLHGGVVQNNVDTGLVRFGAGETRISSLTLAQQQNARIDCMRMFDYIVSPEQIAALSVEFPAVKLYRATAAADADTTWGDLSWTPAWDGGNTQSKAILTTEGGATVALPASITVDEVQLNLAANSTLTLSGPGSLAVTQPITIGNGTLELTGTVTLTQDTTFNGSVVFNQFTKAGDGAIKLSNGATVGVDAALVVTPLGTYACAEGTVVDSAYSSGEGDVKLIPLASAVVSITQSGTTLYYSDLDTALGPLVNAPGSISEDVQVTLLNDTTLPFGYDSYLLTAGYYINGNVITKAVARIGSTTYPTLAAAVGSAADRATVVLLRASSETITLNKAITLSETANFSGTLTGNGTLTFAAFRNNPSITFDNWTGTVVLPEFAAQATVLNKYGVAGSTVVLKGITGGWLGETSSQKMDVAPVLQLDGNVTIKGFSTSWDYTFAELAGTGNFVLDPTDNSPKSVAITKVAKGFTGIITNNTDKTLTIATLDREAWQSTAGGTKLLTKSGNVVANALTVGGVARQVGLCTAADGIYVACTVTIPEVANASATVTVDGVAATGSSPYTVDVGSNVEITWTADSGYKITAGATQTINVIATDVTATAPTVEANSVTFSNFAVEYLADFSKAATITATVTGDGAADATYTITAGGEPITGTYSDGTVTFANVGNLSLGDTLSYTISASGTTSGSSGAQTSTVGNVTSGWVQEDSEHYEATGSWATDFTYSGMVATLTDNTYTANTAGDGIVTITTVVKFGGDADSTVAIDSDAQAGLRVQNGVFEVYGKTTSEGTATWQTTEVAAVDETTYTVTLTINYTTGKFTASVSGTSLGEYYLAVSATKVSAVSYKGTGEFTSLAGSFVSGDIAVDVESEDEVAVSSAFISQYLGGKTVSEATTLLAPGSTTKTDNGCNYFESYALGLNPTSQSDAPIVNAAPTSDGKIVLSLTKANGNAITPAGNVDVDVAIKEGNDPVSGESESGEGAGKTIIIDPTSLDAGVHRFKAEIGIGAK